MIIAVLIGVIISTFTAASEHVSCSTAESFVLKYHNDIPNLLTCEISNQKIDDETFRIASSSVNSSVMGLSMKNDKNVKFIPENISDIFPQLTHLQVSECSLKTLNSRCFKNLVELERLYLLGNQISSIEVGAFKDLGKLLSLELDKNRLTVLPSNVFDSLRSLVSLDLRDNRIETLSENIFDSLANLEDLLLSRNRIKFLNEKLFKNLVKLATIELANNDLEEIVENLFENNSELREIDLDGNLIRFIGSEVFSNKRKLNAVKLMSNQCINQIFISDNATVSIKTTDLVTLCPSFMELPTTKKYLQEQNQKFAELEEKYAKALEKKSKKKSIFNNRLLALFFGFWI